MPRGKNYVNNNKGLALQGKTTVTQLCEYGTGCTRPDCIYRHEAGGKSDNVCLPFLAGKCTFGKGCRRRHPGKQEVEKLLARYKRTRCRHGDACHTDGCLYMHPRDSLAVEPAYVEPDSSAFPPLNGAEAPAAAPKLPENSAWKSAPPPSMQAPSTSPPDNTQGPTPVPMGQPSVPMMQEQMYPYPEGQGMPQWGGQGVPYYPGHEAMDGYNNYFYPTHSPTGFNANAKEWTPSGAM